MTYADNDFWIAYGEYLDESRDRHLAAVNALFEGEGLPVTGRRILDLGCGKFQEARSLLAPKDYLGVDVDPPEDLFGFKADYRKEWGIVADTALNPSKGDDALFPDLIVSLFSVEITASAEPNRELYELAFRDVPTVKHILSAGFYYTDKTGHNPVEEAGGLKSWQTLDLLDPHNKVFSESRLYVPAPSKLFGPNVVEVWKLLTRRV